jgi:hypothetical protein
VTASPGLGQHSPGLGRQLDAELHLNLARPRTAQLGKHLLGHLRHRYQGLPQRPGRLSYRLPNPITDPTSSYRPVPRFLVDPDQERPATLQGHPHQTRHECCSIQSTPNRDRHRPAAKITLVGVCAPAGRNGVNWAQTLQDLPTASSKSGFPILPLCRVRARPRRAAAAGSARHRTRGPPPNPRSATSSAGIGASASTAARTQAPFRWFSSAPTAKPVRPRGWRSCPANRARGVLPAVTGRSLHLPPSTPQALPLRPRPARQSIHAALRS